MDPSKQLPSVFMQMHNGTRTGEGSFNVALKNIFYAADQSNRYKLVAAFPEFFGNEVPEFEIFKKPEPKTINDLLELLTIYGGSIIYGKILPPYEIDQAEASGRLYTDEIGEKFVWDPEVKEFPTTDAEVEYFEKWYPLEMTPPDGCFNEIMAGIEQNNSDVLEDNHHQELIDTLQSIVDCAENDPDGIVSRKRITVAKELLSKINS